MGLLNRLFGSTESVAKEMEADEESILKHWENYLGTISGKKRIIENLPKNVKAVGIFVNETANKIKDIADFCNLDLVQLSGDENAEFLSNLKKTTNQKIIKAFRIGIGKKFPKENFFPIADYILLDSFKKGGYGGTGKVFDWSMAKTIDKKIMFLSGGLNTSNVKIAIRKLNPYCVDVCSGIEKSPGRKDFMKMKEFIIQAKVR